MVLSGVNWPVRRSTAKAVTVPAASLPTASVALVE
jgi:hypothetical protein